MIGVGLRPPHYPRLLERPKTAARWFEAISENFMFSRGRPREILGKIREDYPVALHGVSLSLGGVEGPRPGYLDALRELVREVDPLVVSDHLCFTGAHSTNLHDLLPLPYTREAVETVAGNIRRAQDFLGRTIAVENVSSYLTYRESEMTEWEFLLAVTRAAGCKVLLDINNAFVSATNHGFRAEDYLDAIPADLVAQIHLGGYSDMGDFLFDTHSRAPTDPVWALYRRTIARMPHVPTLIEWDEDLPAWEELDAQAAKAARLREDALAAPAR